MCPQDTPHGNYMPVNKIPKSTQHISPVLCSKHFKGICSTTHLCLKISCLSRGLNLMVFSGLTLFKSHLDAFDTLFLSLKIFSDQEFL